MVADINDPKVWRGFSLTWRRNTNDTVSMRDIDADLNEYRDHAMFDMKFAIKKLAYDSDFWLTEREIGRIIGINYSQTRYILSFMIREGVFEVDKTTGCRRYFLKGKNKRVFKKRTARIRCKPLA